MLLYWSGSFVTLSSFLKIKTENGECLVSSIRTTGGGREKIIGAYGLIFRKTIIAPTTIAQLAIIWLSPIPSCCVSGTDIATLEVYSSKRSMSISDLQTNRSALAHVSLHFYLVRHLKFGDGKVLMLLPFCQKCYVKLVNVFHLQKRDIFGWL